MGTPRGGGRPWGWGVMGVTFGLVRAALAFVVGVMLLIFGIQAWATTIDFLGHAAPARARVVGNRRYVDPKGAVSYCPVLSFRTSAGRSLTVEGGNVCQDAPVVAGRSMAIHYRTDRPATVEVDGFAGTWLNPVLFTGAGLLLVAIPAVYGRRTWRAAHPRAALARDDEPGVAYRPLWELPAGRPLGEGYIARLLDQPAGAATVAAAPAAADDEENFAALDAALDAAPDDPRDERLRVAREARILALYRKGEHWRALGDVRRIVTADHAAPDRGRWAPFDDAPGVWYIPRAESTYRYVGGLLALALGDDAGALDELHRSVDAEPDYAPAHLALGDAYQRVGEADTALRSYQRAARLDPVSAPALYRLARAYRDRGDDRRARAYLGRAVAIAPDDARYRAARDNHPVAR